MDRVRLQQAMLQIMRARTMSEVDDASHEGLDTQYELAMSRMRTLGAERSARPGTNRQGQPDPPPLPALTPEEISLLDSGDARKALMEIAGARRNPDLSPEQSKELQEMFAAVYQQLRDIRESQKQSADEKPEED